ncbi:hypothetical protein D3C71_1611730 [compost metagenome]
MDLSAVGVISGSRRQSAVAEDEAIWPIIEDEVVGRHLDTARTDLFGGSGGDDVAGVELHPSHEVISLAPCVPMAHVFWQAAPERMRYPALSNDLARNLDLAISRVQLLIRSNLLGCIRGIGIGSER